MSRALLPRADILPPRRFSKTSRRYARLVMLLSIASSRSSFTQMWTEVPKGKNKKPVNKDRFISYVALYVYGVGDLIDWVFVWG